VIKLRAKDFVQAVSALSPPPPPPQTTGSATRAADAVVILTVTEIW